MIAKFICVVWTALVGGSFIYGLVRAAQPLADLPVDTMIDTDAILGIAAGISIIIHCAAWFLVMGPTLVFHYLWKTSESPEPVYRSAPQERHIPPSRLSRYA